MAEWTRTEEELDRMAEVCFDEEQERRFACAECEHEWTVEWALIDDEESQDCPRCGFTLRDVD